MKPVSELSDDELRERTLRITYLVNKDIIEAATRSFKTANEELHTTWNETKQYSLMLRFMEAELMVDLVEDMRLIATGFMPREALLKYVEKGCGIGTAKLCC